MPSAKWASRLVFLFFVFTTTTTSTTGRLLKCSPHLWSSGISASTTSSTTGHLLKCSPHLWSSRITASPQLRPLLHPQPGTHLSATRTSKPSPLQPQPQPGTYLSATRTSKPRPSTTPSPHGHSSSQVLPSSLLPPRTTLAYTTNTINEARRHSFQRLSIR